MERCDPELPEGDSAMRPADDLEGSPPRATASKIPVILAVLDGNLVYSYNVYYWHIFNNHPNYGCKSLEYSQNFRSIAVSGLPYLMKNSHFDAVALGHHPTVKRLHGEYRDGVRVPAKEMKEVEARLERSKTLPKYGITIKPRITERQVN